MVDVYAESLKSFIILGILFNWQMRQPDRAI